MNFDEKSASTEENEENVGNMQPAEREHINATNRSINTRENLTENNQQMSCTASTHKGKDVGIQTEESIIPNCFAGNACFYQSMINSIIINKCCGASKNSTQQSLVSDRLHYLKLLLDERTKKMNAVTSDNYPLNGRQINVVPLEICHEVVCKTVNQSANKANLIDQTNIQDQIACTDLFSEAAKLAENQTKNLIDTQAKEAHQKIHSNIVGIIGPPGVGKTTLAKHIAKNAVKNEMNREIGFIFYVQFRDINFEKKHANLLKFLLASSFIDWEVDQEMDKEILKLLDTRFHLMIVLDGLNEASISEWSEASPAVTLLAEAKAETFIKGILGGKLLPRSKKILTSRPRQIYKLYLDHRPRLILNIRGISKSSQQKICEDLCGEEHKRVFECIAKNPRISSICNTPFYCILVVLCIEKQLQQNGIVEVIGSVTEIFASVLQMFICRDRTNDNFNCEKLPELAWNAMISNQYHFTEGHLNQIGIDEKTLNTFLNHRVETNDSRKIANKEKTSFFNHSMLIEFLAAVKLVQTINVETFRANLEHLKMSRFESVMKFLFGLFNRNNFPRLSKIGICTEFSNDDMRIRITKNFALQSLKDAMSKKARCSLETMWKVCSCAYEMHDDSFAKEIAELLGSKLSIVNNVHPGDIAGLCYVLQAKESNQFELNLDPCIKFLENSFCRFFEKMYGVIQSTKIKMRSVDVSRNKVGDEEIIALAKCLPQISTLSLSDCQISTSQVHIITNAILKLNANVHETYFAYNVLADEAAADIACCIHKIDKVHFSLCCFSERGIELLSKAIAERPTPIEHFCFSGNMTSQKIALLSSCIYNINELSIGLRHEKVNVVCGIEKLCDSIHKMSKPLGSLIIRGSTIGDEGFLALSKCIHNINNLKLGSTYDESLTSFGITELAAAISRLNSPMQSFIFDCPDRYVNEAKVEFSYCAKNITTFSIQ